VYTSRTLLEKPLGGIQLGVSQLSQCFAGMGHDVFVLNNCNTIQTIDGVEWRPRSAPFPALKAPQNAIILVNNDAELFDLAANAIDLGAKPYIWLRNRLTFKRFKKNHRWRSFYRYKPAGIFLSEYARDDSPFYYPFRKTKIIPHFLKDAVFEANIPDVNEILARPKRAVFISQPHRGLKDVVKLWREIASPAVPGAGLDVYCNLEAATEILKTSPEKLSCDGIYLQPRITNHVLLETLPFYRAMFYAGSKDETFCFAAAEALACGVPVVTRGIGSLQNRVQHSANGFIERDRKAFAHALIRVLNDDTLWQELRNGALHSRQSYRKEPILQLWQDYFEV